MGESTQVPEQRHEGQGIPVRELSWGRSPAPGGAGGARSLFFPTSGTGEVLARGPRMLEPAGSCSSRKVYKVYLLYLSAISLCQHYAGCQSAG